MKRILFVCHGNICRSPMAEFIMKDLVSKRGVADKFYIESCATSREEIGNSVYPPAKAKLAEHNISCAGKTARQITKRDYEEFDLIIAMDRNNLRNLVPFVGEDTENKVSLMMSYAGMHKDVADPWYTRDFKTTYDDVLLGCTRLFEYIKEKEA